MIASPYSVYNVVVVFFHFLSIGGCSLTAESSKVLILYLASERFYKIFNMLCPGYGFSIFKPSKMLTFCYTMYVCISVCIVIWLLSIGG